MLPAAMQQYVPMITLEELDEEDGGMEDSTEEMAELGFAEDDAELAELPLADDGAEDCDDAAELSDEGHVHSNCGGQVSAITLHRQPLALDAGQEVLKGHEDRLFD